MAKVTFKATKEQHVRGFVVLAALWSGDLKAGAPGGYASEKIVGICVIVARYYRTARAFLVECGVNIMDKNNIYSHVF